MKKHIFLPAYVIDDIHKYYKDTPFSVVINGMLRYYINEFNISMLSEIPTMTVEDKQVAVEIDDDIVYALSKIKVNLRRLIVAAYYNEALYNALIFTREDATVNLKNAIKQYLYYANSDIKTKLKEVLDAI